MCIGLRGCSIHWGTRNSSRCTVFELNSAPHLEHMENMRSCRLFKLPLTNPHLASHSHKHLHSRMCLACPSLYSPCVLDGRSTCFYHNLWGAPSSDWGKAGGVIVAGSQWGEELDPKQHCSGLLHACVLGPRQCKAPLSCCPCSPPAFVTVCLQRLEGKM